MHVTRVNNHLVIRIPLTQRSYDAADQYIGKVPNLVGVIAKDTYSLSQSIDMGYCGKSPQEGMPIIMFETKEELKAVCKEFVIEVIEHEICKTCEKVIYGSFTLDTNGSKCFNCELREEKS